MRFAWLLLALAGFAEPAHAGAIGHRVDVGGQERTYTLYVPAGIAATTPAPLVLVFHGGGGSGRSMARLTQFNRLAEREQFVVAYPDGLRGHWRDGRAMPRGLLAEGADDVAFVAALLDDVARVQALDPHRIFAAGMSNGAIFSHYLALKMPERIAAIAAVAGGIATDVSADFAPAAPVSVLIIHGRNDPLVPYAGGRVAATHGSIVATQAAAHLWLAADGIRSEPRRQSRAARAAGDCSEETQTWDGGRAGSAVTLITLDGGGHTWPGGAQYLPRGLIGAACPQPDATRTIWDFFKRHPKP